MLRRLLHLNQRGFSLVEVGIATALTGLVGVAAVTVLKSSNQAETSVNVQTVIDREFALANQLSSNPRQLARHVNPAALGDCLRKKKASNCASFSGWNSYPTTPAPRQPDFHTTTNLGKCADNLNCVVQRSMRYRWNCTNDSCSSLETETTVSGQLGRQKLKDRVSSIKLDARQFVEQAQLEFRCDHRQQSMIGIDFDQLTDDCSTHAKSTCNMPQAGHQAAAGDCQSDIGKSCAPGFGSLGLDQLALNCVGADMPTRTPSSVTSTATSVSTVSTTVTTTDTHTETETVVTPPPPTCSMKSVPAGSGYPSSPRVFGASTCDVSCQGGPPGPQSYCGSGCGAAGKYLICGDCRRNEMVCE